MLYMVNTEDWKELNEMANRQIAEDRQQPSRSESTRKGKHH